jgi:hypothetical protein
MNLINPKRILVLVDTWGLKALCVLTGLAFLLAIRQAIEATGSGFPGISEFAKTVMDTVNSNPDESEGWEARMHLLFKATVGWAAARIYMATAGLKWDTVSARWLMRRHVVICAGGPASGKPEASAKAGQSAFAVDLALALVREHSVVLSLPGLSETDRSRLWSAGVAVLASDGSMPDLLQAAGAARAELLIAMRDSVLDNIVLARTATSSSFGNAGLECKVMIEPIRAKHEFRLEDCFERNTLPRIRIFNQAEVVARRLIDTHPPDEPIALGNQGVHVVVVGLGAVGQAILLQLARQGHYRSGLKPKVTVIDRAASKRWDELKSAYPALPDWLDVELENARIETITAQTVKGWAVNERPITMAYVCTRDEVANLRISRIVLAGLQRLEQTGGMPRTARVVAIDPPGGCVLADFLEHGAHDGRFQLFSLIQTEREGEASRLMEGLLRDLDDARAKRVHAAYHAEQLTSSQRTGNALKPAAQPWELLEETYRNANRATADHFAVKLRAVGRTLVKQGTAPDSPLSADEIELLARMEHQRWWADRSLDGWKLGKRNDDKKVHDNLIAYDELSEEIRNYDRQAVSSMVRIVEDEGWQLASSSIGVMNASSD